METLNLNKIPSGSNPVVHCSQYDVGRVFRFNLFEGSEVVTLDGTEVIECNVRKLDGTIVTVAVTNTSDSYVDVVTTEQMTAVHGSNYGEIVFKKGSDVIGTVNFILQVEKSPLEGGITSDSSIYNLETQIMDIVSVQYDSANVIFDNAGTSGHGIPYTVTSEGIKTMVDDAIALIPEELNDLSDVDITTPTSGEAVVWDGSKWVNGTVSTVGDLDDLSDVDTTGKQEGDSLRYDSVNQTWVAKPTTVEMTQAEYNAIVDFTPYANTHIVITDAPNLNPTASDIEYSSGVTVADAISSENTPNTASYVYKPTVTEPTLSVGINHNNRTWYYKHGARVCLSIGVRDLSIGLINQDIFTLPVGYRPRKPLSLICCGYSFDKVSAVMVTDTGIVRVAYTQDQGAFGYIEFDAYS